MTAQNANDWYSWLYAPPDAREWEVIEWMRDGDEEPNVSRLADLMHPRNAAWNIAGVFWRPVL